MISYDFIFFVIDLLLIEPSLLPFFDAIYDSIFRFNKTYKKREVRPWLCSRLNMNVVVLQPKKGNGGGLHAANKKGEIRKQSEATQNDSNYHFTFYPYFFNIQTLTILK